MNRTPPKPGPGRPKGSRNRTTANMHEMWMRAFDILGGVNYIVEMARSEHLAERVAVLNGFARQVPLTLKSEAAPLTVNVVTYVAAPNGEPMPTNGTCLIEGEAQLAPLAAPKDGPK